MESITIYSFLNLDYNFLYLIFIRIKLVFFYQFLMIPYIFYFIKIYNFIEYNKYVYLGKSI